MTYQEEKNKGEEWRKSDGQRRKIEVNHQIPTSGGFQQKIEPKSWLINQIFLKGGFSQKSGYKMWFMTNFAYKHESDGVGK